MNSDGALKFDEKNNIELKVLKQDEADQEPLSKLI